MANRILLVEDTEALGDQVARLLRNKGYRLVWAKSAREARLQDVSSFDLIVLDLMLPDGYGLDLLKEWRGRDDTPVLILSARTDANDRVRGIKLGADDYMTKPFWPEELVARVEARLRRPMMQRGGNIVCGDIEIQTGARRVSVAGRTVDLTGAEYEFLAALAKRPGEAISRSRLAEAVLDDERDGLERTLDSHVSRLRKKLGDEGKRVKTVWGVGYRLDFDESAT